MFLRVLFYCYKKTYVKLLLFLIREESNSQIHCFINCTKSSTIIPLRQAEQEKGDVLKKKNDSHSTAKGCLFFMLCY